jgi:hypothetical protein
MKQIIISTIILILSNSFIFGMLAFAEWSLNPYLWDVGTRVFGAMLFSFVFFTWICFFINLSIDRYGK